MVLLFSFCKSTLFFIYVSAKIVFKKGNNAFSMKLKHYYPIY